MYVLVIRLTPRSTLTDTLFPDTRLIRSPESRSAKGRGVRIGRGGRGRTARAEGEGRGVRRHGAGRARSDRAVDADHGPRQECEEEADRKSTRLNSSH